jgi:2-polyprenyl-3-methyl-5-hydroxy-6-metoxy-1,4-benzoquinol methylase
MPAGPNQTFHLEESDLDLFQPGCVICGSDDRFPVGGLQRQPKIELLCCRGCGVVSASHIPSAATLSKFYGSYYKDAYYQSRTEKVAVQVPAALACHIQRQVEPHLLKNELAILDFGGGDGSVAMAIGTALGNKGAGIAIQIVDYNPQVVAQSPVATISISKVTDLNDVAPAGFDLVLASAVLEHLPYPRQTLEQLFSVVRPGGIFYARTPYMVPLRRWVACFGKTIDFTFPAHIHDMGSAFWDRILVTLELQDQFEILISRPSVVETSFQQSPLRTLIAYTLKAPWHLLGNRWGLVGGWEVFIRRR